MPTRSRSAQTPNHKCDDCDRLSNLECRASAQTVYKLYQARHCRGLLRTASLTVNLHRRLLRDVPYSIASSLRNRRYSVRISRFCSHVDGIDSKTVKAQANPCLTRTCSRLMTDKRSSLVSCSRSESSVLKSGSDAPEKEEPMGSCNRFKTKLKPIATSKVSYRNIRNGIHFER